MNYLKKVISVLIAVMMLFGTVASASPYADVKDDASYAAAVEKLSSLGVLKGDAQNNFNPENTITRAEFAAVICRALGREDEGKTKAATDFTDVPSDFWGSGYVKLASQIGIINGYGEGKFGPEDAVTYEQVVKMIVSALGYGASADKLGGYPAGYLTVANQERISKDVNAKVGDSAKRSVVAVLIYNAISTPLMENGKKMDGAQGTTMKTLLNEKLNKKLAEVSNAAPAAAESVDSKLTWAPPELKNPVTINLGETDNLQTLITGKDYIIKLPAKTRKKVLYIKGGRNVVVMGGHIQIPNYADTATDTERKAIYVTDGDPNRIVHIEGVLITSDVTGEGDGIAMSAPNTIIQFQNIRIDHLQGGNDASAHVHADIAQPWGGVKEFRVDHMTAKSTYQGLQLGTQYNSIGNQIFKNVNMTALEEWFPGAKGGFLIWLAQSSYVEKKEGVPTEFINVYLQPRKGRSIERSVWPSIDDQNTAIRPVVNNNYVTWPGITCVKGGIFSGQPAAGDFVPEGTVGLNYKSPGYIK